MSGTLHTPEEAVFVLTFPILLVASACLFTFLSIIYRLKYDDSHYYPHSNRYVHRKEPSDKELAKHVTVETSIVPRARKVR